MTKLKALGIEFWKNIDSMHEREHYRQALIEAADELEKWRIKFRYHEGGMLHLLVRKLRISAGVIDE